MSAVRPILLVEIDVPYCSLTYGTAPCTASIPATGTRKCFNTTRTCQDKENFDRGTLTLRFAEAFKELSFAAWPALQAVDVTPCVIDVGGSMGTRASVKVTLADFQWSDAGLDKYLADRDYNPYDQGTFWGKLRARIPSLESFPLRVRRGFVEDALEDYTTEHYVIDSSTADEAGLTITAKDPLAFTDAKKAQAPEISSGRILAAIDADDLAFTLTPSGIGDLEYPASGKLALSGKEIVTFTRVGDAVTIGARHQDGTDAQTHSADAIAQLVLEYSGDSVADILYDLFTTYTPGLDPSWIDLTAWQAEADTYIGHLYSAVIPAPTDVRTLVNEVIVQAGLAVWWDVSAQRIRMQSLRPVVPGATEYDNDLLEAASLVTKENPSKRVSIAATYYGVANPVNKLDKESNFRAATVDVDDTAVLDYVLPAIRKTFSRWISVTNRAAAERLDAMILARFTDAPRSAEFKLHASVTPQPVLGTGVYLKGDMFQDDTGATERRPFFITSHEESPTVNTYQAEEFNFSQSVLGNERAIFIEVDAFNVNLWDLYNSLYSDAPEDLVLVVYISETAFLGSVSNGLYAFTIPDDFPVGATIEVRIASGGGISGYGGNGGAYPGFDGEDAGPGLLVERPVTFVNLGTVQGGGGGGGAAKEPDGGGDAFAGGGGGAGFNALMLLAGVLTRVGGNPGAPSAIGTDSRGYLDHGGLGAPISYPDGSVVGGDGGAPGEDGTTPTTSPSGFVWAGGEAGIAVQGDSFITWSTLGTIHGARVG